MDVRDKLLTENPWKLIINLSLPAGFSYSHDKYFFPSDII